MDQALDILRRATENTPYEGRLYLVGGIVRDRVMGRALDEDIDIVLEGDAAALAWMLRENGVALHDPVTFERFGTAMVTVAGRQVEIAGARKESYDRDSRKPSTQPGTLAEDAARRDFTVNALLENLHTGEILDLTGRALQDIDARIIRTPLDPAVTFDDDPLRMLRAIRFAVRLRFDIHPETCQATCDTAQRLSIVSAERVRDEFEKILMTPDATRGMELLRETGLLSQFAPELVAMHGVTQNVYHIHDVWTHTMRMLESLPPGAGIILRLAALMHDVGKVDTRSVDEDGSVHFYQHQSVGAAIARNIMHRLKFPNSSVEQVAFLISMHLRVGEYDEQWTDTAVRRLIRDAGPHLQDLITLTRADKAASNPEMPSADLDALQAHIGRVRERLEGGGIRSPLDGREIMDLLGVRQGPVIGEVKAFLESRIIEGELLPGDKAAAAELVRRRFGPCAD